MIHKHDVLIDIKIRNLEAAQQLSDQVKIPIREAMMAVKGFNSSMNDINFTTLSNEISKNFKIPIQDAGVAVRDFAKKNKSMYRGLFKQTKEAVPKVKKFHGELLSVMFFGLAINRVFMGLLQPAFDLVGIFEIWTAVLQVLFLPIALAVLNLLLPLFEWMMSWSEETKLLVGQIVLLAAALGLFMITIGVVGLGILGILVLFNNVFQFFKNLIPEINLGGASLSSFLAIGLTIGTFKGIFDMVASAADNLITTLFKIDWIKNMLAGFGIQIDENATGIENLKNIAKTAFDKIKESLNPFIGEDGLWGKFENWIFRIEVMASLFWKQFQKKIENFTSEVEKLNEKMGSFNISLGTIAKTFEIINGLIDDFSRGLDIIKDK